MSRHLINKSQNFLSF